MTTYAYHDNEIPGSIHVPHDLEYASQSARKTASGLEERHEKRLALQTNDGSLWRLSNSSPVTWELVAPKVPVVGDIGKFFQIVSDGDASVKSAWLALSPDEIYNLATGTRNITIDAGDYKFSPTGAYSVVFDLAACGPADGFAIEYGGSAWLRIGDTLGSGMLDLSAQFGIVSIEAAVGDDFTLGARGETITLNESGQEALAVWFSATSIVGALNEMAGGHTLDDGYNAFGGAGEVVIDDGDLTWTLSDTNNLLFDIGVGSYVLFGDIEGGYIKFEQLVPNGASGIDVSFNVHLVDFTDSPVVAEGYGGQSGNIWSIKSSGGINGGSTATILCLEVDGANWNAGARVLKLISDDNDAKPLAVNNGTLDTAYIERGGGVYFKGYSKFGDGTTGHSLSANGDLLVSGKLEIDGSSYFDGSVYFANTTMFTDDVSLCFGLGNDVALRWSSANAPDTLVLGLGAESNGVVICELADIATNWAHALQTTPTLFIQSDDAGTPAEWISFAHDGTDGVINVGTGGVKFPGTNGLYLGASSDIHIYRGTAGDLTLDDANCYNDRKLQDMRVNKLWRAETSADFINAIDVWTAYAIAAGTVATTAGVANHPGIRRMSSLAAANTGYVYYATYGSGTIIMSGGTKSTFVFQILSANTLIELGFGTPVGIVITLGTWIGISALTATGCTNNGAGSSNATGTTYLCTTSVWYRAEIATDTAGTTATFKIYTCSDGVLVWSESLNPNYSNGLNIYPQFAAQSNAAGGPYTLTDLDFAQYENIIDLVR